MEILSLRESLPEKQSLKIGVATWATTFVNRKANREKKNKKREGTGGGDMIGASEMVAVGTKRKRGSDKLGQFVAVPPFRSSFITSHLTFMAQKNATTEIRYSKSKSLLDPVSSTRPFHIIIHPPWSPPMLRS